MKRASLCLAFLCVLTGLIAGSASGERSAPSSTDRLGSLEQGVLSRVNVVRASKGLRPLVLSNGLGQAALAHSQSMLNAGFFAHESRDGSPFFARIKRYYPAAGFHRWAAGENLLFSSGNLTGSSVIRAWLNSPPHRENLLAPNWREVGIAALHASSAPGIFGGDPAVLITMDFGARSGSSAQALDSVEPKVTRELPDPAALSSP